MALKTNIINLRNPKHPILLGGRCVQPVERKKQGTSGLDSHHKKRVCCSLFANTLKMFPLSKEHLCDTVLLAFLFLMVDASHSAHERDCKLFQVRALNKGVAPAVFSPNILYEHNLCYFKHHAFQFIHMTLNKHISSYAHLSGGFVRFQIKPGRKRTA